MVTLACHSASASDHADPIDIVGGAPQEPGITDLFFFPVKANGAPASPFVRPDGISLAEPELGPRPELTAAQRAEIDAFVVILCVHRLLVDPSKLDLDPYTYRIHMDLTSPITFVDPQGPVGAGASASGPAGYGRPMAASRRVPTAGELRARYGGRVDSAEGIRADATIEIQLRDDASFAPGWPKYAGLREVGGIESTSGVFADPFIFPPFFGANIVGMVFKIPRSCFAEDQIDWILWATSSRGSKQIDHVGRSLRTQNPRFEMLNTLHPRDHVAALERESRNPSLPRDLFLRIGLQSTFTYREWDFQPDVMIYTMRYPVGFPNGRLLTDDVAAMLAQFGDTLLLELSYNNAAFPRATTSDEPFRATFPYLAAPREDPRKPTPRSLTTASKVKLAAIGLSIAALLYLIYRVRVFFLKRRWNRQQAI